ncbi:RNA polymerase sigma factor [Bacillaceae bacterium W0354]
MNREAVIETWYEEFSQGVYHFLVYYNRTDDVDDLLQETFIKAYKNMSQFKGEASPKTWLISIARTVSIDQIRKAKVYQLLRFNLTSEMVSPIFEEQFIEDERKRLVHHCINQLRRNYRDVVICRGIMELSTRETAAVLNWSKEKVDTTYFRAKKQLRNVIEAEGSELIEER